MGISSVVFKCVLISGFEGTLEASEGSSAGLRCSCVAFTDRNKSLEMHVFVSCYFSLFFNLLSIKLLENLNGGEQTVFM